MNRPQSKDNPLDAKYLINFDNPGSSKETSGSLFMPFPTGQNHNLLQARQKSNAWLEKLGMVEPGTHAAKVVKKAAFHRLSAIVYHQESVDDLSLATDFIAMLFFFDDMLDARGSELGANPQRLQEILGLMKDAIHMRPIHDACDPKLMAIAQGFSDITLRLAQHPNKVSIEPFIEEMERYFEGVQEESSRRAGEPFSSVEAYEALRLKVSAVYPCMELGAITQNLHLQPVQKRDPTLQRIARNANLNVSFVNDLCSYKKEIVRGETSNLIMVLEHTQNLSPEEAFLQALQISNHTAREVLKDTLLCRRMGDQEHKWAKLMGRWIRGNFDWSMHRSNRYTEGTSTHEHRAIRSH